MFDTVGEQHKYWLLTDDKHIPFVLLTIANKSKKQYQCIPRCLTF